MTLDELLIGIGVRADTSEITEFNQELENTTTQANQADGALEQTGRTASTVFGTVAKVGAVAFTVLQTVIGGAWAWLNSYIDKVEELQEAEDDSIRTTKEQVEMAKKYKENMSKLGDTIENIKTRVALQFLPTMYDLSKQYASLLDDNKELIAKGINKLLEAVSKAIQVINNVIRFIKLAVESTVGWKVALGVLALAFAWVKRAMLLAFITNPIFWVIAAITALALLIDDFMTYLDGGKSQFGSFWGALIKWTKTAIDWIKNFWKSCVEAYNGIVEGATNMIERIVKAWQAFKTAVIKILTPIYNYFKDTFSAIWQVIKGYVDIFVGIFDFITSAWKGDVSGARQALAKIFGGFNEIIDGLTKYFTTQWHAMIAVFTTAVQVFKAVWSAVISGIKAVWNGYIALVKATWKGLINLLVSGAKGGVNLIKGFFVGLFNGIIAVAKWFITGIGNTFNVVGTLIREPFQKAFDWIIDKFKQLQNMIGDFINKATFGLSGKIMGAVNDGARQVNNTYNGGATNATITVNGAGNPQAVANNVTGNLNTTAQRNVRTPFKI